ncbi:MAG: 2-oxo acid dehydrogenase subunit E2 [Candidatus Bathyarchaeota archaeon]|nr:MAG: 2-oxo acid dehydrogenase subunit E2 [Candidatus Bathyarchaeota archaeon]
MVTKLVMPRLSLTMETGNIIQWFKNEGDPVEKGEPVVEVLSEKITYDVESPAAGILRKISAEEGSDVPVGETLAYIVGPGEELSETIIEPKIQPIVQIEEQEREEELLEHTEVRKRIPASPSAKRMAREHNVDLTQLQGTGFGGRIVEEDVQRFILEKGTLSPIVSEEVPLIGIRKTTAHRLTSSFQTAPHSFIIMDSDMTKAVELREKTRVSFTAMLIYAVAKALREFPRANSTLVDGKIRIYEDINIGVAVSTEKGLLVPVIRQADRLQIEEITTALEDLTEKTRQFQLPKELMVGGTFTVTNLGMHDVDMFLPIINPPEAGILAAGRIVRKPIVEHEKVEIKPIMTLTLAYDHRILDGEPAAIFLGKIRRIIEKEL